MKAIKILFLAATLAFLAVSWTKKVPERKPNIIYIFPDQFRNYSLGFWSQDGNDKYLQGKPDPVATPALDKLASEGIVLNRAVSNFPLCSPYRGMLLTGMYPNNNGIRSNCMAGRTDQLNSDAVCITDVFAHSGYSVGYFGKCHWQQTEPLFTENGTYVGVKDPPGGHYINKYDTYIPPGKDRHGIDYFVQLVKDDHFNPLMYSNDPYVIDRKKDGELHKPGRFSAELESELIIDYLSNTRGQRDPNKPFFVMWALNPPHNPWTEKSTFMKFYDQYTNSGKVELDKLLTHGNVDTAAGNYAPYYFANISAVDYFIGKVLKHLEKEGLAENTIIVFSSDHGEMLGSHGKSGKNVPETESFNIPFIIKWTGKLKHRMEDLILSAPDVMPTLLGLVGLGDSIPKAVQGKNYSSIFKDPGSTEIDRPKNALFLNQSSRGVYTGKYMFVVEAKNNGQFKGAYCYDNKKDPYQMNKIPVEDIKEIEKLKADLTQLLISTNDEWYEKRICSDFLKY